MEKDNDEKKNSQFHPFWTPELIKKDVKVVIGNETLLLSSLSAPAGSNDQGMPDFKTKRISFGNLTLGSEVIVYTQESVKNKEEFTADVVNLILRDFPSASARVEP